MHDIPDDLSIPAFLRRDIVAARRAKKYARGARFIPYPRDGYKCLGKRQAARNKHRLQLRRRAEKMRQR